MLSLSRGGWSVSCEVLLLTWYSRFAWDEASAKVEVQVQVRRRGKKRKVNGTRLILYAQVSSFLASSHLITDPQSTHGWWIWT